MQTTGQDAISYNDAAVADICSVRAVSYSYGSRPVLKNASFLAHRGESVAIVGQSGAGKTTLLRLMAGMLRPLSGTVSLYGVQPSGITDMAARTRLVGMVQQRLDLVQQLSAKHNVNAGMLGSWSMLRSLAALVLPLSYRPTSEALERVGLGGRESERVSRLSGGEQQRVAVARLLVQDPQVIVADEPVSSLDPTLADELLGLLRNISKERGRTVIASLHTPELARAYFDRVIGLREGSVVFDVPAKSLTSDLLDAVYHRRENLDAGVELDQGESKPLPPEVQQ